MLPDGSGSSSSYAALPRVHPSIAIVGLNCPYMKEPNLYTVGIEEVGNAGAFLCSDLASGISGEILYVDGGFNTTAMGAIED